MNWNGFSPNTRHSVIQTLHPLASLATSLSSAGSFRFLLIEN